MPTGNAQGDRQAILRASTGKAFDHNGDWLARFDAAGVNANGCFNGRLLAYINLKLGTTYDNLPGAMAAFATANGATNFSSITSFTA